MNSLDAKADPQTSAEWEAFRFPPRPSLAKREDAEAEEDDGGEEGQGGGGYDHEPPPPRTVGWLYDIDRRAVVHPRLRKQVLLHDLSEAALVIRLIAALNRTAELETTGFLEALEQAARLHYRTPLMKVLERHASGIPLRWPALEAEPGTRRRPAL